MRFQVEWFPRWCAAFVGDVVVWLDVAKADKAWSRDNGLYIPRDKFEEHQWKYARFGEWFLDQRQPVEMAHVGLEGRKLHFTDGRHRFAWMRDHGAQALPVTACRGDASPMLKHLGTQSRECIVTLSR